MFCPRCGANLPEGLVYCGFCGMHIENNTTIINKYAYRQKRRPSPTIFFITLLSIAAALTLLILFSVFTVGNPSEEISASFEATVKLTNGTERFPSRTASLRPSPLPSVSATPTVTPETPSFDSKYIEELITYFNEIALKSEYGNLDQGIVRRWEQPLRIEISGSYTDEDYTVLVDYIDMLKSLKCLPDIQIVQSGGNYAIHFVQLKQMPNVIPGYAKGNWGYITLNWNASCQIESAIMGISTDVTNQYQRNHLILEEFTQGLGLLNDSPKYEDSIFQIEWTEVQSLNAMDYEIVKMLYSPVIKAGIRKEKADYNLKQWLKNKQKELP